MTGPEPTPAPTLAGRLADGEWHRLHPATPLLRGGIALIAILGIVVVNLRDVFLELIIGGNGGPPDPLVWIFEHDYALPVLGAVALGLLLFIGGFYLSWRMHTFRITDELVEVRSGILFRTNRRGRLDRIQGINIARSFLARLVGAAKLEINVAGQDANVQLAYLGSRAADELRREILALASGTRASASAAGAEVRTASGLIEQRVSEFLAPELDPNAAPPQSVVQMHPGRLIGSLLFSGTTVVLLVVAAAAVAFVSLTGNYFVLIGFVPGLIGFFSFYVSRVTRSLRYSIASTPDGVRVGFGLLSTSNETLPPGRIHAVSVSQPLMWRGFGWWQIRINRASNSSSRGAAGQASTTILPVGNLADTHKVLELVLPSQLDPAALELLERGLTSRGGDDGFVNSPRRAAVLRWFSWRRNGFAITGDSILLRRGAIWRELVVVPQARIQSITLGQGPLLRRLGVAEIAIQTVAGPVRTSLGAIDAGAAVAFFGD
ncbi:MAG: PH domain-containing protein, partial [Rhodoglobus sp.]|nr:PH domain-containing protein [Rhodoglobus sp.]